VVLAVATNPLGNHPLTVVALALLAGTMTLTTMDYQQGTVVIPALVE
jgi:hypothetical protein